MQILPISTKELRLKFPEIKDKLSKGIRFMLIYRSKPLAMIEPYQWGKKQVEWPLDKIVGGFHFQKKIKKKITPEFIEKIIEEKYG